MADILLSTALAVKVRINCERKESTIVTLAGRTPVIKAYQSFFCMDGRRYRLSIMICWASDRRILQGLQAQVPSQIGRVLAF